ncbi:DUF6233 domain-containing protein [Actinacidiphila glaucinigra]|uniref:DUF6233 domain-containing protein n=1 Tax=Actinacidiphila glaucinigra TaxID=235986 RepID=UPI00117D5EA7|nr:DUF6233 domain-containing protein [Actinacidiphila glaucinigra]
MHEDLPTDPAELRVIEGHLIRLLARIREQQEAPMPPHQDLPAGHAWLRVIEAHTAAQLRRAGEQLYEVETGDQPWVSGPARGWRLQHLPTPVGQALREVLHRADCWIDNGEDLTSAEASAHAVRPNVQLCRVCRPNPLDEPHQV